MGWEYGDPIVLNGRRLEAGTEEYDIFAELAAIIAGDEEDCGEACTKED